MYIFICMHFSYFCYRLYLYYAYMKIKAYLKRIRNIDYLPNTYIASMLYVYIYMYAFLLFLL